MLHDPERFRIFVDIKRHAVAWKIDFLKTLGDAYDSDGATQSHLVESLNGRTELPLAAVDDDKLRQPLPLVDKTCVAACEHLLHGSEIVGSFHGLDVKVTIVFFGRFAVAEHHARRYRICALYVGIIETLDMPWKFRQTEIGFHAFEQPVDALLRIVALHVFQHIDLVLSRIAFRHLKNLALVASLRHDECHSRHIHVGHFGHYHLIIDSSKLTLHLGHGIG